ncbi:hypothetical protein BABINDRAFT_159676 [Babjeviella inositovora NRRL Y-12698]|uniref:MSP domain-containing protein n=1 Tax=Babjeviella inositovora NRRL Y-12698 TaxID=984486 RepID=A0A1E3R037_9ASCO|nr:uncharacterized protein BABINDRAFT_159676 [Babjeviella inositovora NRRL Y-12698]ODQ83241.1 hypothetical protein BABINDRAFT_159676 [Babjeviella inositovora NRRL Y-12698]
MIELFVPVSHIYDSVPRRPYKHRSILLTPPGPFVKPSTEHIVLKNNTDTVLAFKVKTTAPRLYCVRPNASVVAPGEQLDVSIILQGLEEEPAADFACRDKFLVVTLPCPYQLDDANSVSAMWTQLEGEFKSQSKSKKIRVEYVSGSSTAEVAATSAAGVTAAVGAAVAGASTAFNSEKAGNSTLTATAASHKKDLDESNVKIAELNEKLESNKIEATAPKVAGGAVATKDAPPAGALWIGIVALVLMALFLAYTLV